MAFFRMAGDCSIARSVLNEVVESYPNTEGATRGKELLEFSKSSRHLPYRPTPTNRQHLTATVSHPQN
jgi:hypothetical protein